MMLAGAEIVTEEAGALPLTPAGSSGQAQASQVQVQEVGQAPTRDPVDIHFSNITCTVSLGFNKGEFCLPLFL